MMNSKKNATRALSAFLFLATLFAIVGGAYAASGVVNVNKAEITTLELLPRVGPAVVSRIVAHREENGPFRAKEDLMLVRGVGEATFTLIEPYIVLEGDSTLAEKVRANATDSKE